MANAKVIADTFLRDSSIKTYVGTDLYATKCVNACQNLNRYYFGIGISNKNVFNKTK